MKRKEKEQVDKILYGIGVDTMNRFQTFLSVKKYLTPSQYWYALANSYTDSDNLFLYRRQVRKCFSSNLPDREYLMTTMERKKVESMPQAITIYRAMTEVEAKSKKYGISWTLSLKVAKFFRDTYSRNYSTQGIPRVIVTLTVDKNDIIAFFNGRKEKEIIFLGKSSK